MKRLIIKTAIITFCVAIILGISVFGILSFCAPAVMMDFTASLGMETISADYSYQEFQTSHDLYYLDYSFRMAAANKKYEVAAKRFDELLSHEKFGEYCAAQDELQQKEQNEENPVPFKSTRLFICAYGVGTKYHVVKTLEEKQELFSFACKETPQNFPDGNPVDWLIKEAVNGKDQEFCEYLLKQTKSLATKYSIPENILNNIEKSIQEVLQ